MRNMEIFNKKISENFDHEFEIEEDGLYVIEIIASCKSWLQNLIKFTSFFKDDDLAIKIDNIEFSKLNGKRGLFDGEAAWNGNKKASMSLKNYTYKGISGEEDYNRFDREIIESVAEWNNEFLEQDYPPTEPLDPSLVKAIIYIESRIGYKKGGYPEFIREWETWEQAVIDYNGSSRKYEYQKKAWKIYKDGIDPDNNILWSETSGGFVLFKIIGSIALLLIVFLAGIFVGGKIKFQDKDREVPYFYGYTNKTDEPVKKIFFKNLEEYKKDKDYYGDVFQETVDICEKVRCCMECVVNEYYNDLANHTKSNEQFLKAMQVFDFMKNTQTRERNIQTGDIDNDGENEIIFIRRDVLNNDYIIITIIDKIEDKFKLIEKKMDESYDGYIKLLDVTNDFQPEVLLFMSQGRGGYPLFIYQYLENKKLQKIFEGEFSLFPEYTFSDLDRDGRMEIKMEGELKDAPNDYCAFVERIYEYNEEKNGFVKFKDIERKI